MRSIIDILWSYKIEPIDEKFRPLFYLIVIFAAVFVPFVALGTMPVAEYTGPGLGEEVNFQPFWDSIKDFYHNGSMLTKVLSIIFLASIPVIFLTHMVIQCLGVIRFRDVDDNKFPLIDIAVIYGHNVVAVGLLISSTAIIAIGLTFFGVPLADAMLFPVHMYEATYDFVNNNVPTIVELPYPFPLIMVILAFSFVHYWFHRLAHEFRIIWLLLHRNHHIVPHLSVVTSTPVFQAFPLFVFIIVPYHIALGTSTKLFTSEPMLLELLIYRLFIGFSMSVFNHQEAFYKFAYDNKFIKFWSMMGSNGVYHHQHHDSKTHHKCNIGGQHNMFMIWDRIFGTFVEPPPEPAPSGLIGQPTLYPNPVRITFAGYVQIAYELIHNPSWKDRFKIIFGNINYTPPKTKDFAVLSKA